MLTAIMYVLLVLFAGLGALLAYWLLRPNRAQLHPGLELESWDIVSDGEHNSNTDMITWRGQFLLVHAASPYHLGTARSRLLVKRSQDGRVWETLATLRVPGKDIRDPKVVKVGKRLFLYALPNDTVMATPVGTVLSTSEDGVSWTPFEPVGPRGWLFWRPKTPDGSTWYVPAYWHEHGESMLLSSTDGREWTRVSTIHSGGGNDETAIEFLPDGRMLATARLEVTPDNPRGNADACTLIAVAEPPYESWTSTRSQLTRLDGPVLFRHDDRIFAVGRYQPGRRGPLTLLGGVLSRKRTSLFLVEEDRLVYLSDLPSSGDTSYAGAVLRDDTLYVDYYTNSIHRDVPWLLGMFLATDIRIATLSLADLTKVAEGQKLTSPSATWTT